MSFANELLNLALRLAFEKQPDQATLRRAVSTAYYAAFHLLIADAVSQWAIERHRSDLARAFGHGRMKGVCDDLVNRKSRFVPVDLLTVARNFIRLREDREKADYVNSVSWTAAEVQVVGIRAVRTFAAWDSIRTDPEAEDFLLRMLVPKLRS